MNICVVLVTFNRREDLKKTLELYETQTYLPKTVLVVDNHSTDGTAEMLEEWKSAPSAISHRVRTMEENVGGSGGFYAGMEEALTYEDCDWIFVSDDDAMPHLDALEQIHAFSQKHPALVAECSALCGVVDAGDHYAVGHRARIHKGSLIGQLDRPVSVKEYEKEYFPVDFFSYIGTCIRKSALEKAGLTRKEFFIYSDDFEHALRVGKQGKMLCIPSVVLCHMDNNSYSKDASWRDYYATRNVLIMYREHFGKFVAFRRSCMRRYTGLRSGNSLKRKVIADAISDAKKGVTGLHPVYRPGWNPTQPK